MLSEFVQNRGELEVVSSSTVGLLAQTGKGAPGSECRTYTRLVSPAIGHDKKNGTPYFLIKLDIWSSINHCTTYQKALSYKISKYHLNVDNFLGVFFFPKKPPYLGLGNEHSS